MAALYETTGYLPYTAGDFVGDGAFTIAVLTNPAATAHGVAGWWDFEETVQMALLQYESHLFGKADISSGFGTNSTGWQVWAVSKAAGSAHYRFHKWVYASDGSGTMSHGESSGSANHSDFAAADQINIGDIAGVAADGMIAIAAMWDEALADASLDTLVSAELADWLALDPAFAVELSDWDGATGDNVFAGTSTLGTVSGTVASGTNPTGFNFSLEEPPVDPPDEDPTDGAEMLTTARGTVTSTLVSLQDYLGLDSGFPGGYVVIENTGATTVYVTEGAIGSDKGFALATTKSVALNLHSLDDVFLVTASGTSAVQVACSQKP